MMLLVLLKHGNRVSEQPCTDDLEAAKVLALEMLERSQVADQVELIDERSILRFIHLNRETNLPEFGN